MAIPIHHVADIERALDFYTGVLGARLEWRDRLEPGPTYASVLWRNHRIHLSSHAGDGHAGTATYLPVDDVDALFTDLCERGWLPRDDRGPVYAGPCDQTWGMRELYVDDPDGNCLRFASAGTTL
jgi:catechol 2,3-dioxygenase-like lactoylglutathione lyase family enzyme